VRSLKLLLRYGVFPHFQDSGRLPSSICDARVCTTHEGHLLVFITAKFGWNQYSSFDNMQVSIFCELGLKTLKLFTPQNCGHHRNVRELGPHLIQCRLGPGLPRTKWYPDPSSRLATIDMGRKWGVLRPFTWGSLVPSNTMSPVPRPTCTSVPSGILIHLTVCVRWGHYTQLPTERGTAARHFSAHIYCG